MLDFTAVSQEILALHPGAFSHATFPADGPGEVRYGRNVDVIAEHLSGTGPAIGLCPWNRDETVTWGAIVTKRQVTDAAWLATRGYRAGVPTIVSGAPGGGSTIWVYLSEPMPGARLRAVLSRLGGFLGHADGGLIPGPTPGVLDLGNYAPLPFWHLQWRACNPAGMELVTVGGWVNAIPRVMVSPLVLESLNLVAPGDQFPDGPVCLSRMIPAGALLNPAGLHALGLYLSRAYSDWPARLGAYALRYGTADTLGRVLPKTIDAIKAGDVEYRCWTYPLRAWCCREECEKRAFGIGATDPFRRERPLPTWELRRLLRVFLSGHQCERCWLRVDEASVDLEHFRQMADVPHRALPQLRFELRAEIRLGQARFRRPALLAELRKRETQEQIGGQA